jgi:hypothetical protein
MTARGGIAAAEMMPRILTMTDTTKKNRAVNRITAHDQLLLNRINAGALSVLAQTLEADDAVHKSEERIIRAAADIVAGVDVSASLLDENVAGEDELTVGALDAQTLRLRVTAVLG